LGKRVFSSQTNEKQKRRPDIETLKEIKYLVHDRGVKIAKAGRRISGKTEILSENKNSEVVKRLIELKDVLLKIKDNL
jgi:hypothetical protein